MADQKQPVQGAQNPPKETEPKTDVSAEEKAQSTALSPANPPVEPEDLAKQGLMTAEQVAQMIEAMKAQFTAEIEGLKKEVSLANEGVAKANENVAEHKEEVKRLTAAQEANKEAAEIAKINSKEVKEAYENDRERMKAHLASQKKVRTFIPTNGTEKAGISKEFVCINGYELWVPKGIFVEVPEQVADIIQEYLHIPETVGLEYRLDLQSGKAVKLT